jgi:deoxycytidine triphosphate deaminase
MILSNLKVLELNPKYNLVEGLCERDLENPEGVGLDLRVGEVYMLKGNGFLGVNDRRTCVADKIADIKTDGNKLITMSPCHYLLVKTIEKINSPDEKINIDGREVYLMPVIYPRSSLQRCGISLLATKTDPGYHGELTFGLANLGYNDFEFELGTRMFNVVFQEVYGDIKRSYEGQWNNGRVSTNGKTEEQK